MSQTAVRSLRDRLPTPPTRVREPGRPLVVRDHAERVLRIAADLFEVKAAALVLGDAIDLRIERVWARDEWHEADAIDAARHLFDALAAAEEIPSPAVLEDIAPDRGFRAAAPVLAEDGRRLGAVCLVDGERRVLLSGLQRRLLAEFGTLIQQTRAVAAGASADAPAPRDPAAETPSGDAV